MLTNACSGEERESALERQKTSRPMLRRETAAEFLRSKYGFGSKSMLSKLAVTGGGPKFFKYGARVVLYDPTHLDAWAIEKLGEPRLSTSSDPEK